MFRRSFTYHKTAFILVLLLLTGCKNNLDVERGDEPLMATSVFGVAEAQTWFDAHFRHSINRRSKSAERPTNGLLLDIDWSTAFVVSDSDFVAVESSWKYKNGVDTLYSEGMATENIDRLVVLKSLKNDSILGFRMVILPTENYSQQVDLFLVNNYLSRTADLDGMVLFYDLDGNFVNGWIYDKGTILSALVETNCQKNTNHGTKTTRSVGIKYKYVTICTTSYAGMIYEGEEVIVPVTNCRTQSLTEFSTNDELVNPFVSKGEIVTLGGGNGGGGNTNGGTPNGNEQQTTDPCSRLAQIKNNASLNNWIVEHTAKAATSTIEEGYCKRADGTLDFPTRATATSLGYGGALQGGKYTERVHTHPDRSGGAAIPSVGDLNVLYNMLVTGKMADVATFNYVIVSSTGTLILNIVDEAAFRCFCVNFEIGLGKNGKYQQVFSESDFYKSTYNPEKFGDELAKFFSDLNAGLSCTYGIPTDNGSMEWNTKQVNADCSVSNLNCK